MVQYLEPCIRTASKILTPTFLNNISKSENSKESNELFTQFMKCLHLLGR